jgi:hypothetical protein
MSVYDDGGAGGSLEAGAHLEETTMFRRLALVPCLVLAAVATALAADASGRWQGQIDTPDGALPLSYTFAVDGEALAGTATGPEGERPIENGKIDGDMLTFTVTLSDGAVAFHEATVSEDTMAVTVRGPWGEAAFNLERVKTE